MVSSEEQTLPLLPEAKIAAAYEAARESLARLSQTGLEHYRPVYQYYGPDIPAADRWFGEIAEHLSWGMRVADGFGARDLVETIQAAVRPYASFEYFLAYAVLSMAFEREGEEELAGYRLPPLSAELKEYLLTVLVRRAGETCSAVELDWLGDLMTRVIVWLPYSPTPESYIGLDDVAPIMAALRAREWTELTDAAIQGERQRIEQCWRVIQDYRQKVGE